MLYCARCDSGVMAVEINGHHTQVCPMCGAIYVRKSARSYSLVADLHGAQGVKELLHSSRHADPLHHEILSA